MQQSIGMMPWRGSGVCATPTCMPAVHEAGARGGVAHASQAAFVGAGCVDVFFRDGVCGEERPAPWCHSLHREERRVQSLLAGL